MKPKPHFKLVLFRGRLLPQFNTETQVQCSLRELTVIDIWAGSLSLSGWYGY